MTSCKINISEVKTEPLTCQVIADLRLHFITINFLVRYQMIDFLFVCFLLDFGVLLMVAHTAVLKSILYVNEKKCVLLCFCINMYYI